MIVRHGHHFVAKPHVRIRAHLQRVAKQIKIIRRIAEALGQELQLVLHIVNAQHRVHAGDLLRVVGAVASAGDFRDEIKIFLPSDSANSWTTPAKKRVAPGLDVLDRINAEAVKIGKGNPEFIDLA